MADTKHPLEAPLTVTVTDEGAPARGSADAPVDPHAPLPPVDADRYELRGEYGRGGLGVVMRALDRKLGREVAVKLLQNPSPAAGARFLREATITSRLQHPSIVTVLDVVTWTDGTPSYTMPLYLGRSLRAAIDAMPELGERLSLLPNALAVAEAVAHAHERQVIHRDLKPSNVLLGPLGETVVIDWGLAKSLDDTGADDSLPSSTGAPGLDETRAGEVLGTPAYMAPEQAQGSAVDQRADVYSLGALLYHVLAGRPAYRGSSSAQVLQQLIQGPPADLREAAPGVPLELVAIVRKAMARAPRERYPDAGALAGDLRRFLSGHLVEAHAYTRAQLVWRWFARYRFPVAVVTVAVATIVAIAIVSFRRVERERAAAEASAAREKARANALILTQAETALQIDPTAALAWLKTYPLEGEDWVRVRAIGRDAVRAGVARHIFRGDLKWLTGPLVRDEGRGLLALEGPRTMALWDMRTGVRRSICLPAALRDGGLRDETPGGELVTVLVDGRVLVWNTDLTGWDHVTTVPSARSAALSSDGRWLAVASDEEPSILVDRMSGQEFPLGEGELRVRDVFFIPGTHRVLLQMEDSRVPLLYDVDERRVVYAGTRGMWGAKVSPHGRHVIIMRRGSLQWLDAWTLETHALPFKLYFSDPIDFLPDGRVVLAGVGKAVTVVVWNPRTGAVDPQSLAAGSVAAAPSGRSVASFDRGNNLWLEDVETHVMVRFRGHSTVVDRFVEFLTDDLVASAIDDGEIRIWDLSKTPAVRVHLGARPFEPPIALVDQGQTLIMGAQDGRVLRRRLRGSEPPGQEELFRLDAAAASIAGTPDGLTIVAVSERGNLLRFNERARVADHLFSDLQSLQQLQVTDDGRWAVGVSYHGQTAYVWDLERRVEYRLDGLAGECDRISLSPDQLTVAISCARESEHGFMLFDLKSGATRSLPAAGAVLSLMGFSPSGRYLYAAAADGHIVRWNVPTGSIEQMQAHTAPAFGGHVLLDDVLLTVGLDGLRVSWFSMGASHTINSRADLRSLFVSPDGRTIGGNAVGGDSSIGVIDLATGERWSVTRFGTSPATGLFTGDGRLVTTGSDGAVRIFSPPKLAATRAETRAWLDQQSTVTVGHKLQQRVVCE